MRIRLTVERSSDLEIEADLWVDVPVKDLRCMSPIHAGAVVDALKYQLLDRMQAMSQVPII